MIGRFIQSTVAGSLNGLLTVALVAAAGVVDAATLSVHVVDKSGIPALDTAVFATALSGGGTAAKAPVAKAAIDQVNKEFVPVLSVIQTGTAVVFPNRDNIRHHVYSFSPAKRFELKLYSGQPAAPVIFDKPGIVVLGCNIHDWMISYVVVVDTPYFAKTDATGTAKLDNLPPGDYELKIWHYRASAPTEITASRKLTVGASDSTVNFDLTLVGPAVGGVSAK